MALYEFIKIYIVASNAHVCAHSCAHANQHKCTKPLRFDSECVSRNAQSADARCHQQFRLGFLTCPKSVCREGGRAWTRRPAHRPICICSLRIPAERFKNEQRCACIKRQTHHAFKGQFPYPFMNAWCSTMISDRHFYFRTRIRAAITSPPQRFLWNRESNANESHARRLMLCGHVTPCKFRLVAAVALSSWTFITKLTNIFI